MKTRTLFLSVLAVCLVAAPAPAQESRGTVVGQVTDATGAVLPRASVVLTNLDTGQVTRLTTSESGNYSAPLLPPGRYRLEVDFTGFKHFLRDSIELRVNDRLQLDARMEVGPTAESVTVREGAPLLETADPSLGQVVDSRRVADLPLAHGNPYALISLAPGTAFEGDPKLNRPFEPTHIVGYAINGTRNGTNDVTLDGVANTAVTTRTGNTNTVTASYVPPADAVSEFKVQTAAFDAKMGQTPGGLVNISLKSGTNKLHGTAYFSKMFPDMMANDFFANAAVQARPDFSYNRWGASLNGPVVLPRLYDGHDRTFFMWAYEGIKESRPRGPSNPITVPTEAERGGNFSELLALGSRYQIYNPLTRRASGSRFQADPFPGNIIPQALLNPVARKVLEYFPLPRTAGTTADHLNNFPAPNEPENIDYWTHIWRVDHNLHERNRFFVRANVYSRSSTSNDWFRSYASGQAQDFLSRGASFDDVHTFSPTFLANLRYGYNRYVRLTAPKRGRGFDLTALGFPASLNAAIDPAIREFPFFNIRNAGTNILQSGNIGEDRNIDTHSLVAALTKMRGSHSLEFGHEFRAYRYNRYVLTTTASGSYDFDETYTRGPLDNSTASPMGQGFAGFLLGIPDPSTRSFLIRNTSFAEQSTAWMFYFQDNWRLSRKLNVTLGLRYELEGPLTERYNRSVRGFDFNAVLPQDAAARAAYTTISATTPTPELPPSQFRVQGGLLYAGVNGQPRTLWERLTRNFMPRLGVAYSANEKTIVRAGYGIFFSPLGIRRGDVIQDGFSQSTPFVPTDDNINFRTLSNPFPNGLLAPSGSSLGILTDVGTNAVFFNTQTAAPYMQRWQLSIQRELLSNTFVEVGYVGNRGTRLETETASGTSTTPTRNLNGLPNQYLSNSAVRDAANIQNNSYFSANITNPFFGLPGMGSLTTARTVARSTLLRPFPQFVQVNTTDNNGYSWYHALQARVERRYKSGLTLNIAYTWSKFMEAVAYLNPGDPAPSQSVAAQDHTHRATVSWIYQLPFGRGMKFLTGIHGLGNAVLGGWQLQGIYTYQTGAPLTWADTTMLTDGKGVALGDRNPSRWFDPSAFLTDSSLQPQNHFRTWPLRFSALRADGINNWDLSVIKRWTLKEGMSLQFRSEFLNTFNHTRFGAPAMDPGSRSFGQVSSTGAYPRQIQIGLKLLF